MISRSVHAAANDFLSLWLSNTPPCVCHAFLHSSVQGHLGHAHVVSCLPDSTVVGRGRGNWCDGSQSLQSHTEQTTFSPLCSQLCSKRVGLGHRVPRGVCVWPGHGAHRREEVRPSWEVLPGAKPSQPPARRGRNSCRLIEASGAREAWHLS